MKAPPDAPSPPPAPTLPAKGRAKSNALQRFRTEVAKRTSPAKAGTKAANLAAGLTGVAYTATAWTHDWLGPMGGILVGSLVWLGSLAASAIITSAAEGVVGKKHATSLAWPCTMVILTLTLSRYFAPFEVVGSLGAGAMLLFWLLLPLARVKQRREVAALRCSPPCVAAVLALPDALAAPVAERLDALQDRLDVLRPFMAHTADPMLHSVWEEMDGAYTALLQRAGALSALVARNGPAQDASTLTGGAATAMRAFTTQVDTLMAAADDVLLHVATAGEPATRALSAHLEILRAMGEVERELALPYPEEEKHEA